MIIFQIYCFNSLYTYKIMRNYSADSYHRLRSLYEQKFLKDGWQPFHQPIPHNTKNKQQSSTIDHPDHHKTSSHSKSSANAFFKHQEDFNHPKTVSLLKQKDKTNNNEVSVVCMYGEQSPRLFWFKDARRKSFQEGKTIYTSDVRERKWINDSLGLRSKKQKEKTLQLKKINEEKGISKKSVIIKMLEQLRAESGKKAKKQSSEQQVSLQGKNTIIHLKEKRELSILRKHNLKDCSKKSRTCRQKMLDNMQRFEREVKIERWNVVQGQY